MSKISMDAHSLLNCLGELSASIPVFSAQYMKIPLYNSDSPLSTSEFLKYHTSEKSWISLHNCYILKVTTVAQLPNHEYLRIDIILAAD